MVPRFLSIGVLVGALVLGTLSLAFAAGDSQTQETISYKVTLTTGPVEMM
jgi:hypothetical protein